MDIDDDRYLKSLSPGPTTPSQIHLHQLEPVLIGGETLDPIKEETDSMGLDYSDRVGGHGSNRHDRHDMSKGAFWPEKPRIESLPGTGESPIL